MCVPQCFSQVAMEMEQVWHATVILPTPTGRHSLESCFLDYCYLKSSQFYLVCFVVKYKHSSKTNYITLSSIGFFGYFCSIKFFLSCEFLPPFQLCVNWLFTLSLWLKLSVLVLKKKNYLRGECAPLTIQYGLLVYSPQSDTLFSLCFLLDALNGLVLPPPRL